MWQQAILFGFIFLLGWAIRGEFSPYRREYNCPKCKKQKSKRNLLDLQQRLGRALWDYAAEYPDDPDMKVTKTK